MRSVSRQCVLHSAALLGVVAMLLMPLLLQRLTDNLVNLRLLSSLWQEKEALLLNGSSYLQGVVAFQQQRYTQAIMWLRRATSADPALVRWYLAQAQNKNGDWQTALGVLDLRVPAELRLSAIILFEHLPALPPEEQARWQQRIRQEYPEMLVLYAAHLLTTQQFDQAEEWAKLTPDYAQSVDAQMIVGRSYFYTGRMAEAEAVFQSIYTQLPVCATAYWYGRVLAYNGKLQMAIPLLEEAVQETQDSVVSWYLLELGGVYAQVGRCAEARAAFELALQRDMSVENAERIAAARANMVESCE